MSTDPTLLILAAVVPALVAAGSNIHAALSLMVNAEIFLNVVEDLLRKGNRERATKLASAISTPVTSLTRYALSLQLPRFDNAPRGDYRAAPVDEQPARVATALEVEARAQLRRLRPSVLGGVPTVAVPLLALCPGASDVRSWIAVAAFIGVGSALLSVWRYARVRRQLREVQRRLAPWVMSA